MKFDERMVRHACSSLESRYPSKDCLFYRFGLAIEILRVLVDNEWVNQVIFPNDHPIKSKATEKAMTFLRSKGIGYQFQERVYRLATRLYQLKDVPNISQVIENIKNGDLEGAYAEIEAGRHLHSRNIPFIYVLPRGTKGLDFDIEITSPVRINCEVKHKIEGTALSKETLERTLSDAKSQVPENEPSLLFIKIPEEWIRSPEISGTIERTLGTFFPRSINVIGIMFRWEERGGGQGVFLWKYRFEENPHFADTPEISEIIDKLVGGPVHQDILDDLARGNIRACQ